jgi:hypothetical protein
MNRWADSPLDSGSCGARYRPGDIRIGGAITQMVAQVQGGAT